VVPCCIANEFKRFDKQWNDVPRILLVGTTNNKNTARVFEACKGLDIEFLIVGNLDETQNAQLESLKIPYKQFQNLERRQVVQLYEDCDVVMFVSTYEGFGIPILEGQAVGRPVITSSIPPMCDVAGAGALLVDPFDVGSINKGVLQLLGDAALREKLVTEGFRNVEMYSAKAVAEQYASLYREILNRK
jgi:glycosyltransferase involved in cell wall biosynthesis